MTNPFQSFLNETFSPFADARALILGLAQTMGATFNAWVPLLIFNTGTQAPLFKKGFTTVACLAGAQAIGVVALSFLGKRIIQKTPMDTSEGAADADKLRK